MLADLFNAVVNLSKTSISAKESTNLIELPDGRSMLVKRDGTQESMRRPRTIKTVPQTIDALVAISSAYDADLPIYIDEARAIFHAIEKESDAVIEHVAVLALTYHEDLVTVSDGIIGNAYRPKDLVNLGRTKLVDLFVDPAQKVAWRETFKSIVATSGKELRTETGSTQSNYGVDVKAAVRSVAGSIENWDEFELEARVFQQLPDFRQRIKLALISDGESGTFRIELVGSTLDDALEAAIEKCRTEIKDQSGRDVIRATAPDSLLPTLRV